MGLTAKEHDAMRSALESDIMSLQKTVDRCEHDKKVLAERIAALGPRPAERSVTWGGCTWTHDGEWFMRNCSGCAVHGSIGAVLHNDVPHDVALRVLLLAYPDEPARWMNVFSDGTAQTFSLKAQAERWSADCYGVTETAAPLYRAPVGIAAGACVVKDGKLTGMWSVRYQPLSATIADATEYAKETGGTVYDTVAVPRKEAT